MADRETRRKQHQTAFRSTRKEDTHTVFSGNSCMCHSFHGECSLEEQTLKGTDLHSIFFFLIHL